MSLILNRAKETTATTGTGTVTVSGAVVPFQTWAAAQAGTSTTRRYSYMIEDGNAWEIGEGIFNEGAGTITRNLVASSTGSLLNLSGSATISCVAKEKDSPQVIEKVDLNGLATYAFLDIPQEFEDLELEIVGRTNSGAAIGATTHQPAVRVNNLATSIYDSQRQFSQNATGAADQRLATAEWTAPSFPGTLITDTLVAGYWRIRLHGYARTVLYKTAEHQARQPNAATSGNAYVMWGALTARLTAAITRLDLFFLTGGVQFTSGSYAILRGLP